MSSRVELTAPAGQRRPAFQGRALTSVVVTMSFVILAISGLVLGISPPGRIANWTDWAMLGLRKSEWANLHIWFSLVFLAVAAVHLVLNWRPLVNYFKNRSSKRFGFRREWVLATGLCAAVFIGVQRQVPPFATVLNWTEQFRASWENPVERPPIPHAELLTIQELAEKAGVDLSAALERLQARGLHHVQPEIRMAELAKLNRLPARQLYDVMIPSQAPGGADGPGSPGQRGPGGGPGQKTLAQFCADEGIDISAAQDRLSAKGLKAAPSMTLREIATRNGYEKPYEILEILRSN